MADISGIPGIGYMGGAKAPAASSGKIGYMAEDSREVKSELGKDDFLQLLSAQLQNQNPLEPMNDTDFTAQLAQFSSLEAITNMSTAITSMVNNQAYSMVGQYVIAQTYVDGVLTDIDGMVDCVYTQDGEIYAQIGDYTVPVSAINTVVDKDIFTLDKTLLETTNLIGKEISATVTRDGAPVTVEGVVTRVSAENGTVYAYVDNGTDELEKVPVSNIFDIKEKTEKSDTIDDEDNSVDNPVDDPVDNPVDDPVDGTADNPADENTVDGAGENEENSENTNIEEGSGENSGETEGNPENI